MMLALKATKPPNLDVVPSTASFSAPGQMGVYVLDSNKEATLAFTLGMVSKPVYVLDSNKEATLAFTLGMVTKPLPLVTAMLIHCTLVSKITMFPSPIPVCRHSQYRTVN